MSDETPNEQIPDSAGTTPAGTTPAATTPAGPAVEPPKRGRGLMITLIVLGSILLAVMVVLLLTLLRPPADEPVATPTVTVSVTPSPSETTEPVAASIESFTAEPMTVDCAIGAIAPVQFSWVATGETLWFGFGTDDASELPSGTFPTTHEMEFNYECGQPDSQQRYTITVEGTDGDKVSSTIVITETP